MGVLQVEGVLRIFPTREHLVLIAITVFQRLDWDHELSRRAVYHRDSFYDVLRRQPLNLVAVVFDFDSAIEAEDQPPRLDGWLRGKGTGNLT